MAVKKIYDIAVVTGSYQQGNDTKNRYKTVGAVMQREDGGKFLSLDRSFNPAGVPFREGSDQILLSLFPPKDGQQQGGGGGQQQAPQQRQAAPAPKAAPAGDDDIPF